MRNHALTILFVAAAGLGGSSCTDYFRGTHLVFELDHLPVLHRIEPADKYDATANPTGELCADDAYVAAHPDGVDDQNVPYQQAYEYHAWATINGAPVRLARFTVRECTVNTGDTTIKNAVTSLSYVRLPATEFGYPDAKAGSAWYGIVNSTVNSVAAGGVDIDTEVRIEQATEIFVTREATGVAETAGPQGTVLMEGPLVHQNLVYTAKLAKVTGPASGLCTAIPADRVSAW